MKRIAWFVWCAIAGLACVVLVALAFGGVTLLGAAGSAAARQARQEQPITHTYMTLGRDMAHLLPALRGPERALAMDAWGRALPVMRDAPSAAADRLFDSGSGVLYGLLRLAFWMGPLLLLAALVGVWRRPRAVRLIGPGVRR